MIFMATINSLSSNQVNNCVIMISRYHLITREWIYARLTVSSMSAKLRYYKCTYKLNNLINYSLIYWSDPLSNSSSSISLSLPSITSWHCIHRIMLIWRSPWKMIWTELNVWQLTTIRNFPNPPNIQQYHILNIY